MRNLRFSAAILFATLAIAHPANASAQTSTVTASPMINASAAPGVTATPIESTAPGTEATATASPIGGDQTETTTGTGTTSTETTTNGGGGRWGWLGLLGLLGLFGLRGGSSTAIEDRR